MKTISREIRRVIENYVESKLSKRMEIKFNELNEFLEKECEFSFCSEKYASMIIEQAKENIGFVYIESEEE